MSSSAQAEPLPWFRDRGAWRLIFTRYVPWLAGLNLLWEIAQLPLYTIWKEASPGFIIFAVAHCTVGDILIGTASLMLALVLTREGGVADWRWRRIIILMLVLGPSYTIFSEWLNTTLFRWTYSELMPIVKLGPVATGVSPLLQWLVVSPLAAFLAARRTAL